MKCNKETCILFAINYKNKLVRFKPKLHNKKTMHIKEFAVSVLGIDAISTEIIAMYIGKLSYDTYNKGIYDLKLLKKTRHGIKGKIKYDKTTMV